MACLVNSCCCGCTLRTGTLIIGWLALIGCILNLLGSGSEFTKIDQYVTILRGMLSYECDLECKNTLENFVFGFLIWSAISVAISLILSIILLNGVYKSRPQFLTPFIVYNFIMSCFNILLAIVALFFVNRNPVFICTFSAVLLLGSLLNLYFILVIRSYKTQMLRDQTNEPIQMSKA